jgi:hypothetical protein
MDQRSLHRAEPALSVARARAVGRGFRDLKEKSMARSTAEMTRAKSAACALGLAALLAPSLLRAEPKVSGATKATITNTATTTTTHATGTETGVTTKTSSTSLGDTLGGHVGVAVPLLTLQGYTSSTFAAAPLNKTQTVADQFALAFPIGVTVKTSRRLSVDFEVIVQTSINPTGETGLTIDPGVIYDWGILATGLRLAVPVGTSPAAIGIIPLIHRTIVDIGGAAWFVEADFPTLYHGSGAPVANNGATGTNSRIEFNAVLHTGFGF